MIFTNSILSGTLDRKSKSSLFGMELGLIIRRLNLIMPQDNNRKRIGTKCKTKALRISKTTANHVNSGTEKLNVLRKYIYRENIYIVVISRNINNS